VTGGFDDAVRILAIESGVNGQSHQKGAKTIIDM
jgi:hypothetical protein